MKDYMTSIKLENRNTSNSCMKITPRVYKVHPNYDITLLTEKLRFTEHCKLSKGGNSQTTLGVDFRRYESCVKDVNGECCHRSTWIEYVRDLITSN